ncbi:hypothetical protein QBC37DRAFT_465269 [Rhypophila decipiens]|uniref:Uncharacterized protein n=1 Tax=Rhypophila decipiens TaxID=261697 RepID=A0AAN6Y9N7_9PEZI|nr:hypothetical protein QBC37DRAFT_465269 [Rhypophila decipiens]
MAESGTHLGALTTTFTPPSQCTIGIGEGECETCDHIWLGGSCDPSVGAQDVRTCWPPVDRTVPAPVHPYYGWGYYSPGISCPAGHTTACSATAGHPEANAFAFQFSLAADETAAGCCPTGFICSLWGTRQTCQFNMDQSTTSLAVQTVTCDTENGQSGGLNVLTMPQGGITLLAPLIQMNFKATDLPPSTVSSTLTSSGPANSGLNNNASASSDNSGLSGGTIAGIAIGTAILVLGILGAGIFIWRKKRADRNMESDHHTSMNYGPPSIASPGPGHADLASTSSARYAPLGTAYHHPSMEHRVASPGMTELSGADATAAAVPAVGTNRSQEGKWDYPGHQMVAVEAPRPEHSPRELRELPA